MNFGESSPEESAFNKESDRKAAEYFATKWARLSRALDPTSRGVFTKCRGDRLPSQMHMQTHSIAC